MTDKPHEMPSEEFKTLAQGGGGPAAVAKLVAGQHSKHKILLPGVLNAARSAGQPDDRLATAGYQLLAKVQRYDSAAAEAVIRYPSVGAWALHAIRGDEGMPGARPGRLAAVAAAAAIKAGMPAEIEVPVTDGAVALPSLGAADADGATAVVRTQPAEVCSGGLRVAIRPGAPGWHELRRVRVGSRDVLLDDLDPFRMPAADSEPTGRLAAAEVDEFAAVLRGAWDVLAPDSASEIADIVRVIVPYQAPPGGQVSNSSPDTFGAVAMSLPPDPYTCAEILVHETQHVKLCALLDLVTLTKPDNGQRYYAPWRPDPRPASGLIQGTYAFLGVAGFWRRHWLATRDAEVSRRAETEFARWRDAAAAAAQTLLTSGQLTRAGTDFTAEMAQVLAAWLREPVSDEALALAGRKANSHRADWLARNAGSVTASP